MDKIIKKLGKPRSFLVFFSFGATCGLVAAIGLSLHFVFHVSFSPLNSSTIKIIFWIFLSGWLTSLACLFVYYAGQLSGKYVDLKGRGWSDLPW
jgi:hypothetical protein